MADKLPRQESEEDADLERRWDEFTKNPLSQKKPSPTVASSFSDEKRGFFSFMADFPWPFLLIIPIAYAIVIAFGWTTDDKVENRIENLWIKDTGSYARDRNYANSLGVSDLAESAFAAMAISRDRKNILTADRLEEIRERMEQTEATTVRSVWRTWFVSLCGMLFSLYSNPHKLSHISLLLVNSPYPD